MLEIVSSTKVAFFNDLYDLAEATGTDWEALRQMIGLDDRIGLSHTMVPDRDGKRGFRRSMFPKILRHSKNWRIL